jgi:hypothetical protein
MSVDVLRVTSITIQVLDEPIATALPDGLRLERLECSMPIDHRQELYMTFVSETVEPIIIAVRQMLVGAIMTIQLAHLQFRGRVIACTADHLAPGLLPEDELEMDELHVSPCCIST